MRKKTLIEFKGRMLGEKNEKNISAKKEEES